MQPDRWIAYLFPNLQQGYDVGNRHKIEYPTHTAGVTDPLSILAKRVAWHKICDDAHTDIVETTEETMLPFRHYELAVCLRKNENMPTDMSEKKTSLYSKKHKAIQQTHTELNLEMA